MPAITTFKVDITYLDNRIEDPVTASELKSVIYDYLYDTGFVHLDNAAVHVENIKSQNIEQRQPPLYLTK